MNVPINVSVEATLQKLENEPSLADRTTPAQIGDLLNFVSRSTYLQYNGSICEQREGAAMRRPVSAVNANLYMESFEEKAIATSPQKPRVWKHYVDDTFTVLDCENIDSFLQHLNNQQPSIRFTMETESDSKLTFLDVAVSREWKKLLWKLQGMCKTTETKCRKPKHYQINTNVVNMWEK